MFLGEASSLELLYEMKEHTMDLYNAIQQADFNRYGLLVNKTWEQNKALDSGTNPKAVESIINLVKDYCLGYKLPGAGGGGFLYMVAKDIEAAGKIRQILTSNRPNDRARFVEMTLSTHGQQISRS
jgi:galactokinase/mevalonate kinase-like predicted kinase